MRGELAYIVYRILGLLVGGLPPRWGYRLATWVAWMLYRVSPGLRRAVTDNIRHVVGPRVEDDKVQALVRQALVYMLKGHYDLFRLSRLTTEQIKAMTRLEGWDYVEQAHAEGRGMILVSVHLGNVDLLLQLPLAYGLPTTAPIQRVKPERLFRYVLRLRQSQGVRLIPADEPMIGLFRALKRNECILLPFDRDVGGSSRVIHFFDAPTRLPDGAVQVAWRTGAPILPVFATRLPDNSFLVQVEPPAPLPHTGDREADVQSGMLMLTELVERYIARHPEQWLLAKAVWPENSKNS